MNKLAYHRKNQLFLEPSFQISIPKEIIDCKSNQWPSDVKPIELVYSFKQLQDFIKRDSSWSASDCTDLELQTIETNLSKLITFLEAQKKFAQIYWKSSPQKIQLSTIHLYIFLQILVKSIIPDPTMSLFECRNVRKMCINLKALQDTMNLILKYIKPINDFLHSDLFSQQVYLTHNFVNNWVYFLKKLPHIKGNHMNHIPELLKYIKLKNQIVSTENEQYSPSEIKISLQSNLFYDNSTDTSKSLRLPNDFLSKENCFLINGKQHPKGKYLEFKFPQYFKNRQKKTEKTLSISESPNSLDSNIQNKSPRFDSAALKKKKTSLEQKKLENKKNTKLKKKMSIMSSITKQEALIVQQEKDEERSEVVAIKKENIEPLSPSKASVKQKRIKIGLVQKAKKIFESQKYKITNIDTNSGQKISRGWNFVRDYVNKRIARRKLQNLIGITFELTS